jgi:uncharacterized protein (DUF58 family)
MAARFSATLLFVAGLFTFGLGVWTFLTPASRQLLILPENAVEVEECPVGQETEILIEVRNSSRQPIRLLGLTFC